MSILLFLNSSSSYALNFQIPHAVSQKLLFRLGVAGSVTAGTGYVFKQQYDRQQELPYTINLMWINRDLQAQKSLFQDKEDTFAQSCLNNVYTWATCNPKSIINLWFDSKLTPEHTVAHIQHVINEHMKKYPQAAPIVLKDVHELSYVNQHPEVFSHKTPVYFRADLLRVVAGLETVRHSKNNSCFVYADFDITPMTKKDLFDASTQQNLQKYGMVMADGGNLPFENSFYMLTADAPNLLKSLELTLVELNIQRAYNALKGEFYHINHHKVASYSFSDKMAYYFFSWLLGANTKSIDHLQQAVYDSLLWMFWHFYHTQKWGTLKTDANTIYHETDGLAPFGLDCLRTDLSFEANAQELKNVIETAGCKFRGTPTWIPTKKIESPPASMNYK